MSRPTNKADLIEASELNFAKLNEFIGTMNETELNTPFDFSSLNKKEAHWSRDKDLKDVLAHLYEWHQLMLKWVRANMNGKAITFLPAPYNWKTYGEMNVGFWQQHQSTSLEDITEKLNASHREVMELLEGFTDEQLFTKSYYKWTGTTSLGAYFISNTSSHYDWALKKLRTHRKLLAGKAGNIGQA